MSRIRVAAHPTSPIPVFDMYKFNAKQIFILKILLGASIGLFLFPPFEVLDYVFCVPHGSYSQHLYVLDFWGRPGVWSMVTDGERIFSEWMALLAATLFACWLQRTRASVGLEINRRQAGILIMAAVAMVLLLLYPPAIKHWDNCQKYYYGHHLVYANLQVPFIRDNNNEGSALFVAIDYVRFWLEGLLMGVIAGLLLLIFHRKPLS